MFRFLVLTVAFVGGCATKQVVPQDPEPVKTVIPATTADELPSENKIEDETTEHPYKREEPLAPATAATTPAAAPIETVTLMTKEDAAKSLKMPKESRIAPDKALGWLKNGNTRFVKGTVRKDGQSAADIKRVAKSANPHAVILACSESIAPPEIIFDQKLGEIAVIRNLGASVDESSVRAIEESVKNGVRLVVVLDHTGCAVAVNHVDAASEIKSRSKLIDSLSQSGELLIQAAVYDQDNGRVRF